MANDASQHLWGLVDMGRQVDSPWVIGPLLISGSNGIRFSITDMSPPTARIMPTLFQDRCGISLFDAQYRTGTRGPIPDDITNDIIKALLGFQMTCQDFGVPGTNVRIIATEATRQASNSVEYRANIEKATGWKVEMLPKEEEGRIGAFGVASSFVSISGLVLDLGGGSVQLTWMISVDGDVHISPKGSVSLPYGAAALMRLLSETEVEGDAAKSRLQEKITSQFKEAIKYPDIPQTITATAKTHGGLKLYLSGGGFRGWGYILMDSHPVKPYPIPIINGFEVPISSFAPTNAITSQVDNSIFGVSSRRASQVPAVSFLITALLKALPAISTIHFSQGGVREGTHFSSLEPAVRSQDPLVVATRPFAAAPEPIRRLVQLLSASLPRGATATEYTTLPDFLNEGYLTALANLLNVFSPLTKDIRASAALRSTTVGILAGAHGISHESRAVLALSLFQRWGGDISPCDQEFFHNLQNLVGPRKSWWARYIGQIASGIGRIYPSGKIEDGESRLSLKADWRTTYRKNKVDKIWIALTVGVRNYLQGEPGWIKDLKKLGKKGNWAEASNSNGEPDTWGVKIEIEMVDA
jgi:retrograde regulation protein 2